MSETPPIDAAKPVTPRRLSGLRGLPLLTMSLNLALMATIFVTRKSWDAWVVEQELPLQFGSYVRKFVAPDGRRVLLRGCWGELLFDLERRVPLASFDRGCRLSLNWPGFSPDGRYAVMPKDADDKHRAAAKGLLSSDPVTAPWDCAAVVVDARTGSRLFELDAYPEGVYAAAFSPDSRFLVADGWGGALALWDMTTGNRVRDLDAHGSVARSAEFSPDGRHVLTVHGDAVFVWDVGSSRPPVRLAECERPAWAWFSAGGTRVVAEFGRPEDKEVRDPDTGEAMVFAADYWPKCGLWDARTGERLLAMEERFLEGVLRDGTRFVTKTTSEAVEEEAVYLHDAETGRELASMQPPVCGGSSPDGTMLVTWDVTGSRDPKVWDAETGRLVASLDGFREFNVGAFLPGGKRRVMGGFDHPIVIVDLRTGKTLARLSGHHVLAAVDDRRVLIDDGNGKGAVFVRIRPEWWWGVLWLPHFWIIAALAVALVVSGWRDLRGVRRGTRDEAGGGPAGGWCCTRSRDEA